MQPDVIPVIPTDGEKVPGGVSSRPVETAAAGPFESAVATEAEGYILLPVRFHPDARVWEIAECPEHLDKQDWFKLLCARAGGNYMTRAGGRGFFRLTRPQLEALKVKNAN